MNCYLNVSTKCYRCRHGYFHIVNNIYTGWEKYAIGGSADPTINSQGNVFMALDSSDTKEASFSNLKVNRLYLNKMKGVFTYR